MKSNANLNIMDRWHGTPLADAVRHGHSKVATYLHEAGGSLEFDEEKASGELCELARKGDLESIRLLLQCKCSVDAMDYDKRSCLHLAASEGNVLIVEALLDAGATINVTDRWDGTPLADAVRHGHRQVADMIYKRNGDIGFDEARAAGELCELARKGDLERLKMLLSCGCEVGSADYDKRTALHLAASEGNMTIVAELMAHSKDVSFKDRWVTFAGARTSMVHADHQHRPLILCSSPRVDREAHRSRTLFVRATVALCACSSRAGRISASVRRRPPRRCANLLMSAT